MGKHKFTRELLTVLVELVGYIQEPKPGWFARLATGSWFHLLQVGLQHLRMEAVLWTHGNSSFQASRSHYAYRRAKHTLRYGRPLNKKQRETVKCLEHLGVGYADIRSTVVANLIAPDGSLQTNTTQALLLRLLGWFFNSSVIFLNIISTTCTWASEADVPNKVASTLLVLMVHGFLIYHMSFYTYRPTRLLRNIRLQPG